MSDDDHPNSRAVESVGDESDGVAEDETIAGMEQTPVGG